MAGYLGAIPVPQATQHRESFTATSGQTTFNTAGYTVGFLDVYLNGVHQSPADFTATNGSDVVLASGASADDVCDIISYTAFEVADQTFTGTTTLTGNLLLGDNDKAIFGTGSDLLIYHDGNSKIADVGDGKLELHSDGTGVFIQKGATEYMAQFLTDGAVSLYHDNAAKLATASTGVDITGTLTSDGLTMDTAANSAYIMELGANRTSASQALGIIKGSWDSTVVAQINLAAGDDTTNKDNGRIFLRTASAGSTVNRLQVAENGDISFYEDTGTTAKLFWDASAESLLVGKTVQSIGTDGVTIVNGQITATSDGADAIRLNRKTSDGSIIDLRKDGTTVGSISVSGSATAYNTSSDYRLKTDAQPMTGASARVQALNPVNFEWIADGTRVDGFLAHEAQAVVPECVTGTKDAMMDEEYQVSAATGDIYTAGAEAGFNEVSAAIEASPAYYDVDGNIIKTEVIAQAAVHEAYDAVEEVIHSTNVEQPETLEDGQQWRETTPAVMGTRSVPDMQGIDQSKMVPLLVASLQEALARITVLEGN